MSHIYPIGFIFVFPEESMSPERSLLWSYLLFFISIICVVFGIFYIIKLWIDRAQYLKNHREYQQLYLKIEKQMRGTAEKIKRGNCYQKFLGESSCLYYLVEELLAKHASDTKANNLIEALEILQTLSPIMDEIEKIADKCIVCRDMEFDMLRWDNESPNCHQNHRKE